MIEGVESKKQLSTAKPLVKGFNFFKSGHVLYIGYLHENFYYIKSQVLPSMKKEKVYTCFLVIASIGSVLSAHCNAPLVLMATETMWHLHCLPLNNILRRDKKLVLLQKSPVHLSLVSGLFQGNARVR